MVRLYISGFHQAVTKKELKELFKPFGQVEKVQIARYKELKFQRFCRGFAHFEIKFASQDVQNHCLRVYNGSKWKTKRIQLEIAHPSFSDRRHAEICQDRNSALHYSNRTKYVEIQNFKCNHLNIAGRSRNTQVKIYCGGSSNAFECIDGGKEKICNTNHRSKNSSFSNDGKHAKSIRASTQKKPVSDTLSVCDFKFTDFELESFSKNMKKKGPQYEKRISISANFFRE